MTTVVVTPTVGSIELADSNGITAIVEVKAIQTVEILTEGPQGQPGMDLPVLLNNPEYGSVVYYDPEVGTLRANNNYTFTSLVDGGNA